MTRQSSHASLLDNEFDVEKKSPPTTNNNDTGASIQSGAGQSPDKSRAVKLLIAHEDNEQATRTRELFQRAGWPTHAHRVSSVEDLEDSMQTGEWNLIISYASSTQFLPALIGNFAQKYENKIHAIFLDDHFSATNALQIMQCGFRDYLTIEEDERLLYVATREIDALSDRQRLLSADNVLAEVNARSQLLLDSSLDAIAYVTDGMIVNVNQAFAERLGFENPEDLDCYPFTDLVTEKDQETIRPLLRQYQKGKDGESTVTIQILAADERVFTSELCIAVASYDGEPCTQIILRAENHAAATGGENSELAETNLEYIFSLTERGSMHYIEIDLSPEQRRQLGLQHYSTLIDEIGETIKTSLPSAAKVNRYQQDKWLIVIPEEFKHEPQAIATELCQAVAKSSYEIEGTKLEVTLSIGISRFGVADMTPEIALDRAYAAASEVQHAGGNNTKMFAPKIANASGAAALQIALQHESFLVRYQPVVGLAENNTHLYEVVLNLADETTGEKPAAELISSLGLESENIALDRWLFEQLCNELKNSTKENSTQLLMPLTTSAMMNADFIDWAAEQACTYGIEKNTIGFVLGASTASNHSQSMKGIANNIRKHGFTLCLDNANTSDQDMIRNTGPEFLKLDSQLTALLSGEEANPELIREAIAMAANLNTQAIASNVSSASELAQLWQTGVPYIQGSYMQEPGEKMDYEFSDLG